MISNPLFHLKQYRIILGSGSPRRRELLKTIWSDFTVSSLNADEDFFERDTPEEICEKLAVKKSDAYTGSFENNELLITADTIVYLNGEVLNKPANSEQAIMMLQKISGRTHSVYTGVCIRTMNRTIIFHKLSNVTFAEISAQEAAYYIESCKPFDKAGGYGIQDWIGMAKIENIQGCYYNVMGLPVQRLYDELKEL
jgi:septum formation protein